MYTHVHVHTPTHDTHLRTHMPSSQTCVHGKFLEFMRMRNSPSEGVDASNLQVVQTPSGPQLVQTSGEDGDSRSMEDSAMPVSSAEESDMDDGYMPGESQQVTSQLCCSFDFLVASSYFYKRAKPSVRLSVNGSLFLREEGRSKFSTN